MESRERLACQIRQAGRRRFYRRQTFQEFTDGIPPAIDQPIPRTAPYHDLNGLAREANFLFYDVDDEFGLWISLDGRSNLGDIGATRFGTRNPEGGAVAEKDLGKSFRDDRAEAIFLDGLGGVL